MHRPSPTPIGYWKDPVKHLDVSPVTWDLSLLPFPPLEVTSDVTLCSDAPSCPALLRGDLCSGTGPPGGDSADGPCKHQGAEARRRY